MAEWTYKILGEVDSEKLIKEWFEFWKPKLTFHDHGTGPYKYVDGVPCYMRYHGAKTEEEANVILELTRLGQGLIEAYAPEGSKAVVGEAVDYRDYNHDTYLDHILREHRIGRWPSIITVKPRSCYGFHVDYINPIHIPLETNDGCLYIEKGDPFRAVKLDVGYVYEVNAKQSMHTFVNAGSTERFHLLGAIGSVEHIPADMRTYEAFSDEETFLKD